MLISALLSLFLVAVLLLPNNPLYQSRFVWFLAFIPFVYFFYFLSFVPQVMRGITTYQTLSWFGTIGVDISVHLDGLSLLFALLITGIGTLIVVYSIAYLNDTKKFGKYFCYLFLFMASMLGIILLDNLITLFICWELTSISSYLLIGFRYYDAQAREAALNALLITSSGALCLLAGFVLLGNYTATLNISDIVLLGETIIQHEHFHLILFFILIGAFTKSAQFPFHFWLPNAMEAPTPVSAYLHSATMVQAGIYLLARFHPLMSQSSAWFVIMTTIGAVTMMIGVILAFRQTDMKLILAYTTITALGSLVFLLGSDQVAVIKAAIAFIISHALYKATLFMVVGDIETQTGTRQINEVRGLRKHMPLTFVAALVSCASMAGLPPLLGFYVKELVYEANLAAPIAAYILTGMVVFANMMMAALAFMLIIKPFFGHAKSDMIIEANYKMSLNAFFLAFTTLFISIVPFTINQAILSPAASAVLGYPVKMTLTLWHGFTPSLALSLITLLGAIILYMKRYYVKKIIGTARWLFHYGPTFWWQHALRMMVDIAVWQTKYLQSGYLRTYQMIIMATIVTIFTISMWPQFFKATTLDFSFTPVTIISALTLLAALLTLHSKSYFRGLIFLSLFGLMVTLIFVLTEAPDVAMTQVFIETLIVVIIVLNLYRQPPLPIFVKETNWIKYFNMVISIIFGMAMTVFLLQTTHQTFNSNVSDFYLENSLPISHGRNVVNTILVDFRALDTMGEIMVVVGAAIGVFALLKKIRRKAKE